MLDADLKELDRWPVSIPSAAPANQKEYNSIPITHHSSSTYREIGLSLRSDQFSSFQFCWFVGSWTLECGTQLKRNPPRTKFATLGAGILRVHRYPYGLINFQLCVDQIFRTTDAKWPYLNYLRPRSGRGGRYQQKSIDRWRWQSATAPRWSSLLLRCQESNFIWQGICVHFRSWCGVDPQQKWPNEGGRNGSLP